MTKFFCPIEATFPLKTDLYLPKGHEKPVLEIYVDNHSYCFAFPL